MTTTINYYADLLDRGEFCAAFARFTDEIHRSAETTRTLAEVMRLLNATAALATTPRHRLGWTQRRWTKARRAHNRMRHARPYGHRRETWEEHVRYALRKSELPWYPRRGL